MRHLLFSLAGLLFLSSPSFAAPSTQAKVADHQYSFGFSPLMLLVGGLKANVDFVVAPDWTVGPNLSYWRYTLSSDPVFVSKYDVTSSSIGVRANWFKNGALTQGLYVGPSVDYVNVKVETRDSFGEVSGTAAGFFLTGIVGYGWFWESFNMMLGAGGTMGFGPTKIVVKDSSGTETTVSTSISGLALEYSLGWKF